MKIIPFVDLTAQYTNFISGAWLRAGRFPDAENLAKRILSLPMYPELNDDQIGFVADAIRLFFAKRKTAIRAQLRVRRDDKKIIGQALRG